MDKKLDYLESFTKKLFDLMDFAVDVTASETEGAFSVAVEGDDLGAVIGRHGATLNAIEHIISLAATQEFGEYTHVAVDAGKWREHRKDQLDQMAQRAIERVKQTGKPYEFPPLSASERRLIHLLIAEHDDLESVSEGEGHDRHIVLKRK